MKKQISKFDIKPLIVFCCFVVLLLAFVAPKYSLVGKWSVLNLDGTASGELIDFKKDNTYTVALPDGNIGERGNYLLKDSVFSLKNIKDVCGKDYWGKYKLVFYGNDSVHLALISDTCTERRTDIVGYNPGLKRIVAK